MKITFDRIIIGFCYLAIVGILFVAHHDGNINSGIEAKVNYSINHNATRSEVINLISYECSNNSFYMGSANECKQFIASKHFEFLELGK